MDLSLSTVSISYSYFADDRADVCVSFPSHDPRGKVRGRASYADLADAAHDPRAEVYGEPLPNAWLTGGLTSLPKEVLRAIETGQESAVVANALETA